MMGRKGDYTGVPQTCPLIDSVINSINDLFLSSEEMTRGEYSAFEKKMEEIRQHNSNLRDFANKQCEDLEETEKDRDYYRDKIDELDAEIKELKTEIKDLEKELAST